FWCTADIGWVTGHSYVVYGPLANGATSVMYEGAPNHPQPDRFWRIIEELGVTVLYTAPTAIRAFVKWGDEWPRRHDLSSLRLLGTVGEPINPEAWMWYHRVIGGERCPIVDTWWQTETGGIMISPLPGAIPTKPGSATLPLPGVVPEVRSRDGQPLGPNQGGYLVITRPWPGMLRAVYGDPERYMQQYWSQMPGIYFTGDGARRDQDGYFWVMGRIDDVVNVSGHRRRQADRRRHDDPRGLLGPREAARGGRVEADGARPDQHALGTEGAAASADSGVGRRVLVRCDRLLALAHRPRARLRHRRRP